MCRVLMCQVDIGSVIANLGRRGGERDVRLRYQGFDAAGGAREHRLLGNPQGAPGLVAPARSTLRGIGGGKVPAFAVAERITAVRLVATDVARGSGQRVIRVTTSSVGLTNGSAPCREAGGQYL